MLISGNIFPLGKKSIIGEEAKFIIYIMYKIPFVPMLPLFEVEIKPICQARE